MCGRFSLFIPARSIAEFFLTLSLKDVAPRYNIAPTQPILAVLCAPQKPTERIAVPLHWGLVPAWARDCSIAAKLTNARAETLREKPSFRGAYRYRRCLIPASGFYEWQRRGSFKQPMYITSADETPLAMAGLWEHWSGPEGQELSSATIITTSPNEVLAPIHNRMPVFLHQDHFQQWLDPSFQDTHALDRLLAPCPNAWLTSWPVGNYVGNSRHQGPRCIEPERLEPPPQQMSLFES